MELKQLCEGIHLQEEVRREVEAFCRNPGFDRLGMLREGLKNMETEAQAREELGRQLGKDPKRFGMLACMLACAADLHQWYQEKGISDQWHLDTCIFHEDNCIIACHSGKSGIKLNSLCLFFGTFLDSFLRSRYTYNQI